MAKRYFNWTLAIVLVVATAVLVVSAVALRGWQRRVRADRALGPAQEAYERGDWEEAARQFGRYVSIHGDDAEALLKYAEAQENRRPVMPNNLAHAQSVYSSILRRDRETGQVAADLVKKAAVALVELDLQRNAFGEAELNASQYLEQHDHPTVRRLLGVALRGREHWAEAAGVLADLIEDHPNEVLAYEIIGTLAVDHPDDVNRPADHWFDEAVRRNPGSALAYVIRAAFRRRSGDLTGAQADLEQAETLNPSETEVRLRLIAELANTGARDEATGQLKALQAEVPEEQSLYRTWAMLALTSGSTQEMQTVAQTGLEALARQPWDFMPVATELYLEADQDDKANECVARMREKGAMPATVAYLEGRLAERQGHLQEAAKNWSNAISLNYNDYLSLAYRTPPPVRMALASALERLGDVQSAIGQMRTLVSEASNDPGFITLQIRGRLYLAQLLARTGNWSAVMDETRRVRSLDPNSTAAALLEVQARMALLVARKEPPGRPAWQDIENQLEALDEATDGSLPSGLLRVRAAVLQGRFTDAGALLDELDRRFPGEAQIAQRRAALHIAEAASYDKQGDVQQAAEKEAQAVSILRRAIEESPQNAEPVLYLASLLERQQKVQACESVITEAMARIEQSQARRDLGLWLAWRYVAWGQDEKRYELLARLAPQYPTDIQIKRSLLDIRSVASDTAAAQKLVDEIKTIEGQDGWQWRLEQAKIWCVNPDTFESRYAEIIALLQENLQANSSDTSSRLLLAAAYKDAGEIQAAVGLYRELLRHDPNNVDVIVGAADALSAAGRGDEARQILAEAEQRDLYHPKLRRRQLVEDLRLSDTAQDSETRREALVSASHILEEMLAEDPNDVATQLKLALVLARQQKFEDAQIIIDDLRAADPQALDATAAQVQLYIEQGDTEKAMQLCDEVVKNLNNALAHVIRARTYETLNQPERALADFTRAIELEPQKPVLWRARAGLYRALGRMADAVADVREALELAPEDLSVQKLAVTVLLESGGHADLVEAERLLDDALADWPHDPDLRLGRAKLLLTRATAMANEQARGILTDLTDRYPKQIEAWRLLGRLELSEDEPSRAVGLATQGLAHNPGSRQLLQLRADAEWRLSPTVAIDTLKTLANQYPKDIAIVAQLAYAYVDSGAPATALRLMRKSVAGLEGGAHRRGQIVMATMMHRVGDKAGAKSLFDELVQAEPDDFLPVLAQAELFAADQNWTALKALMADWCSGHPDDVQTPTTVARRLFSNAEESARRMTEELLRSVLERHPASIDVLHLLAILMHMTDRDEEAARLYRRILDLDSNDVVAMNGLAWFLCESQRQYQEALDLATRGLALAPHYSDLRDTRGVIYYRLARYEDAVRELTMCVDQYSGNAPALTSARFHLGRAYIALGHKEEAREELTQSLALQGQIGGLTPSDRAEAKRLLAQVQEQEDD